MATQTIAVRIQKSNYIHFEVTVDQYGFHVVDIATRGIMLQGYNHNGKYVVERTTREIYYFQDIIKAKIARAFKIKWY